MSAGELGALLRHKFEGSDIRLTDLDGDPWFVAADVAHLLGYAAAKDMTRSLEEDEKGKHVVPTLGGEQEVLVVSEAGLYRAILQRRMTASQDFELRDQVERFQRWVFHDVLPSIRRRGSYGATPPKAVIGSKEVQATFRAYHSIARLIGLEGNQATLSANRATVKVTGMNALEIMGATHLIADVQDELLIATNIGTRLGGLSARQVNQRLAALGFQEHDDGPKSTGWHPTEKGRPFGTWFDTSKRQGDGTPVLQWKWRASIVDELRAAPPLGIVKNPDEADQDNGAA